MPSAERPVRYELHELAFRTQYAELKERTLSAGALLAGTPGTLYQRAGTGSAQSYRVFYAAPGRQAEEWVGPAGNETALAAMRDRMDFAQWAARQVSDLRRLGFQVADKSTARVLVELHNRGAFVAGLAVVGTLAYATWLNELGARTVVARTQDLDLGRRRSLKLATPLPFLEAMQATQLPFTPVPALPSHGQPTTVKLPGREGLRVDVLTSGPTLEATVALPEMQWHGQTIPHYDYLLEQPGTGAVLAGGHCVPIRLPRPERFVWHKLYSSVSRTGFPEKAAKDLLQAATLAAVLTEHDSAALLDAASDAPKAVRLAARKSLPSLRGLLAAYPEALDQLERGVAALPLRA